MRSDNSSSPPEADGTAALSETVRSPGVFFFLGGAVAQAAKGTKADHSTKEMTRLASPDIAAMECVNHRHIPK